MSGLLPPIGLSAVAIFLVILTYQNIRRGGARVYTLERETILRRATFALVGSTLLFLAAVGLLIFERQQLLSIDAAEAGEQVEGVVTATPTPELGVFPPTPSATPTVDSTLPTATATPLVCRAVVAETGGNGLTLRDSPGGDEVTILAESSLVQLVLEEEPQELNGFTWVKVRAVVGGVEGWVAESFLELGPGCQ
jgi:hypothetical protein